MNDAQPMTAIQRLNAAKQQIMIAHDIQDLKDMRDKAEAIRQYTKQAGESLEIQNHAAEVKLFAERKIGVLIPEQRAAGKLPDPKDGRPKKGNDVLPLSDYGISKMQSSRYQALASIPEDDFEARIEERKAEGEEVTQADMLRLGVALKREQTASSKRDAPPLPTDKYRIVYADPPWSYGNRLDEAMIGTTTPETHYPSMSIDQLCRMDIKSIMDKDSVLFLWVTSPLLAECWSVIKAWGFKYKTSFVWDKVGHNFGHYNSVRHELLLVCTRGSCTPDVKKLYDSVQTIEKSRKHSEKPEEFRAIIDHIYTFGRRLELFSRVDVEGWEAWGNELP